MLKHLLTILLTTTTILSNTTEQRLQSLLAKIRRQRKTNTPINSYNNSTSNHNINIPSSLMNTTPKRQSHETSIENCNLKLNLQDIFKTFPLKAICKPMRIEFENGLNSSSRAVYSCIQKNDDLNLSLNFMIYIKSISLMGFKGNRVKIFEAMSDPSQIYWKVSNSDEFLDIMDPENSLSCEMIKFGFSLLTRNRNN